LGEAIEKIVSEEHLPRYLAEFDFPTTTVLALGIEDQETNWRGA
jgi:hypothetical protein